MPLTLDTPRAYEIGDINDLSVAAGVQIFEGSAVGIVALKTAAPARRGPISWTSLMTIWPPLE